MLKTASQIADQVLEKIAISKGLVRKVLRNFHVETLMKGKDPVKVTDILAGIPKSHPLVAKKVMPQAGKKVNWEGVSNRVVDNMAKIEKMRADMIPEKAIKKQIYRDNFLGDIRGINIRPTKYKK